MSKLLNKETTSVTINDMPFYTCPHCDSRVRDDDWYDTEVGDIWECPECEKEVHVTFIDTTTHIYLSTEKE